ncbi:MAG: RidA family protein [Bryobacterales bacterium]|nr:RidA family protein [Bryobacterales bacterium]
MLSMLKALLTTVLLLAFTVAASAAGKKLIHPKEFPKGRPFSPGIMVGNTLYIAGQTGQELGTGKYPDNFEDEVKRTLDNIGLVLKEAGMSFENAVAVQVHLTDMELFQRMNKIYMTYFPEPRPVRTTVGVTKLAGPAKVEITVTAAK